MGRKNLNATRDYLKAIKTSEAGPKLNSVTMAAPINVSRVETMEA
jgi:hypothetical protein